MDAVELVVKVFPEQGEAKAALQELEKLVKQHELRVVSLAIVEKDPKGLTSIYESQDVSAGKGALWGALIGGLLGLVGGPAGVVIGAAAGAATGGVTAHKVDMGFAQDFLDDVKNSLRPGNSLLLALVEETWSEMVTRTLEGYPGTLLRHAVKESLEKWLDNEH